MRIALGADSAGKPLLDVIAAHLARRTDLTVTDLSGPGFYADVAAKVAQRAASPANTTAASCSAAPASASAFPPTKCRAFAPR